MKPARSKQLRKATAKSRSGSLNQDPVEVFCRVRPLKIGSVSCLKVVSSTTVQLTPPESATSYRNGNNCKEIQHTFKEVFDEDATQKEVFENVALYLVKQLIAGKNGLLFTYGVTGSGKTFTMTGKNDHPGIMPRCLELLFRSITEFQADKYIFKPDKMNGFDVQDEDEAAVAARNEMLGYMQPKTPKTPRRWEGDADLLVCNEIEKCDALSVDEDNKFSCFVTYIEIYNNNVFDLLDSPEEAITKKLQNKVIREDANRNMYIHAVTEVEVKSPEEALEVFSRGQKRKRVAHTMLNEESSRSHSVFTIRLVQAPLDSADDYTVKKLMTVSQLSLVDLAGSERTNRTKNTGQRLREAGNINNSLMTLRTCLEILRENQQTGSTKIVPYRDSRLTHLFKNYFDGEGAVRMIVCVNPRVEDYDETAHVLKFAELTQEVQVARPTPLRLDIGLTPGRRRAQLFKRDEEMMDILPSVNHQPSLQCWPNLKVLSYNDEDTLRTLENFLVNRESLRATSVTELCQAEEILRRDIKSMKDDLAVFKDDHRGLQKLLEDERQKSAANADQLAINFSEKQELLQKLSEREEMIRRLQADLDEKDFIIARKGVEKEKVKEKCQAKLEQKEKKMRKEMHKKILQTKEENQESLEKLRFIKECIADAPKFTPRSRREYPLTPKTVNTAGTLYQAPSSVGPRCVPVSNPRHRRSRSAGGVERWLDHCPAQPVPLNTVMQPTMRKRKSITKLTEMQDVANPKTSKYCLTTQEQDTDGELETKLYKGDVIQTRCGGAQVVFNDVETLKQSSPTAVPVRKRSIPDENTEARCRIAVEGHGKRPRS